jgi:putative PIN family toxin of toxin-antitoxin system
VCKAVDTAQLLISDATLAELVAVLSRPKFDPYITIRDRQKFVLILGRVAERVAITQTARACRGPKDNMLLEPTINGRADWVVTGDRDLLALGIFQGIPILTPARYVASSVRNSLCLCRP